MNIVKYLRCNTIIICFLVLISSSLAVAREPSSEWKKNHKFATLTVYVKSNRDDIAIAGAKIRIRRQARKERNLKRDVAAIPLSPWYEVKERTDATGKLVIIDRCALTGTGVDGKAVVKRTSHRPWKYLEIEVSATDFRSAKDSVWISFWEPNPSCHLYLSPQ